VFHESGTLRSDADGHAVYAIRQICSYVYKADWRRSPGKDQAVIDRFVQTEQEISNLMFDAQADPILKLANLFTRETFRDFDVNDLKLKHGPGSTANGEGSKFEHRLSPNLPVFSLGVEKFFVNQQHQFDIAGLRRAPVLSTFDLFNDNLHNVAEVVLVDKDARGPRLISKDLVENMYFQQGIMNYMVGKLENEGPTQGQIWFTDNSTHRRLAQESSTDRKWATIDLKDASDRVTLALVEEFFSGTPMLDALRASRAAATKLPDGRIIKLSKFAPMGSATCFPVMAYVLYTICALGLFGNGYAMDEAFKSVFVFGDDIIVPTEQAEFLCKLLSRYGLLVNRDKSFIHGHFRESCGADYFKGVNVTPVRLRHIWTQFNEPDHHPMAKQAMLIAKHATSLSQRLLLSAAEYYYSYSEQFLGPLPYGTETSPFICRVVDSTLAMFQRNKILSESGAAGKRITRFRTWRVQVVKTTFPTTGWGHLDRVLRGVGSGDSSRSIQMGQFDLPHSWLPKRDRSTEINLLTIHSSTW